MPCQSERYQDGRRRRGRRRRKRVLIKSCVRGWKAAGKHSQPQTSLKIIRAIASPPPCLSLACPLQPTTRGPTWQRRNRASNYVQCIFTSTLLVIYPSQQKHKNTILNEKPLANQISPLQSLLPSHFKYQPIPSRLDSPSLPYPSLA